MRNAIIEGVEKAHYKAEVPKVRVGDSVDVHVRIVEGSKERIQLFSGVVIADAGVGVSRMVTVRRIVSGEGVERVFPLNSPKIAKFESTRSGHVRRAKLYYLRDRVGKKQRLRDRRRGLGLVAKPEAAVAAGTPGTAAAAPAAKA
jgi:large subunit ribosomal protein L19